MLEELGEAGTLLLLRSLFLIFLAFDYVSSASPSNYNVHLYVLRLVRHFMSGGKFLLMIMISSSPA